MSFYNVAVALVVAVGGSMVAADKQAKAQKEARRQAEQDAIDAENKARAAETFAETEGKGVGQLGTVSLEIDEDEETETKLKTSNVRI